MIALYLYVFTMSWQQQKEIRLTCQSWSTPNGELVILQRLRETFVLLQQQTPDGKQKGMKTLHPCKLFHRFSPI